MSAPSSSPAVSAGNGVALGRDSVALLLPATTAACPASPSSSPKSKRQPFWLGGAASMGAACVSHPLDLLKVRLQCAAPGAGPVSAGASMPAAAAQAQLVAPPVKEGLVRIVGNIVRTDGVRSLYAGLSASLMRQATYSTVRFGVYEQLKTRRMESLCEAHRHSSLSRRPHPTDLPMLESIGFSMVSGALGGVAGNPPDLVNVRMQNDKKLPEAQRRGYKNVFDGLYRVAATEGVAALWGGVGPNIARAMLMTTGQLASYDLFKGVLTTRLGWSDKNIGTHLSASCLAGVVATVITQPVDVVKTRVMNSGGGVGSMQLVRTMVRQEGVGSFFKGFVPALTRLGPHTIATFIFLEQLKKLA